MLSLRTTVVSSAALAMVFAASPAAAQEWTAGVKSGAGQALYTGKHEFDWRTTGPNSALYVNRSLGGRFSQQFEVGESRRVGVSTTGGDLTFSATYLDLLFLTRMEMGRILGARPYFLFGPSAVYGLDCNLKFVTSGLVSNIACDENTGTNRLDVGAAVAGGVSIPIGPTTVDIEARGSTTFRSVVVPLESKSSQSVAWTVLAGLSMPMSLSRTRRPAGVPASPPGLPLLEPLASAQITEAHPAAAPELSQAAGAGASSKRITLTAVDADARTLLVAIAREAGISLVVSNDVRRRVSVSFTDTPPEDALRAIIADAELTVIAPPTAATLPAVVYYQLPVNVNEAPAEAIAARFGVSAELARWVVENRVTRPASPVPPR